MARTVVQRCSLMMTMKQNKLNDQLPVSVFTFIYRPMIFPYSFESNRNEAGCARTSNRDFRIQTLRNWMQPSEIDI